MHVNPACPEGEVGASGASTDGARSGVSSGGGAATGEDGAGASAGTDGSAAGPDGGTRDSGGAVGGGGCGGGGDGGCGGGCAAPLRSMPARSAAAETLLSADRLTLVSLNVQSRNQRRAAREVAETTRLTADVAGVPRARPDEEGGAVDARADGHSTVDVLPGGRLVPGAGEDFVTQWQRIESLAAERRAAHAAREHYANDTLFALALDQRRECAGEPKLSRLREFVQEVDAAQAARDADMLTEPASLGARADAALHARSQQGLSGAEAARRGDRRTPSPGAHDMPARDEDWAPWRPGVRTYEQLCEIARMAEAPRPS